MSLTVEFHEAMIRALNVKFYRGLGLFERDCSTIDVVVREYHEANKPPGDPKRAGSRLFPGVLITRAANHGVAHFACTNLEPALFHGGITQPNKDEQ